MTIDMILAVLTLAVVLLCCIKEIIPPHLAALSGFAFLVAAGLIDQKQMLSVFSNSAPFTIACMFILAGAIESSGLMRRLLNGLARLAKTAPRTALGSLYGLTAMSSAFINNTPVVLLIAPMLTKLGKQMNIPASKLLIPLSYAAIMGGMCTLIGTSTNLLVDGVAQQQGLAAFTMFELAPGGLAMLVAGVAFILFVGRFLLPVRTPLREDVDQNRANAQLYWTEIEIEEGSAFIDKTLKDIEIETAVQADIIDVIRPETTEAEPSETLKMKRFLTRLLRRKETDIQTATSSSIRDIPLKAGYRIAFRATREQILEIREFFNFKDDAVSEIQESELELADILITEGSRFVGVPVSDIMALSFYGLDAIGIHRRGHNVTGDIEHTVLNSGDILIIEGPSNGIQQFLKGEKLNRAFTDPEGVPLWKIILPVACLTGVIVVSSIGLLPIASASLIGAVILMLSRCIMMRDAYHIIQWPLLILIYGMLGISVALESTGAAALLVDGIIGLVGNASPLVVLSCFYLLTSLLTEVMSNNAAAVILTPLAIGIAQTLGVDPRPFVVAVMLGASASFATPLGYQTNTYVYGIGNYRFSDFLRIGIPMNLIAWAVATFVIPIIWPL